MGAEEEDPPLHQLVHLDPSGSGSGSGTGSGTGSGGSTGTSSDINPADYVLPGKVEAIKVE